MRYDWSSNIIQIIPTPHICAVFTDEIERLEWIPAAGMALYRREDGGTDTTLFIVDVDGVVSDPVDDINFVGWYSGHNRPTDGQIKTAVDKLTKKSA